jgi:hypothetical protein
MTDSPRLVVRGEAITEVPPDAADALPMPAPDQEVPGP